MACSLVIVNHEYFWKQAVKHSPTSNRQRWMYRQKRLSSNHPRFARNPFINRADLPEKIQASNPDEDYSMKLQKGGERTNYHVNKTRPLLLKRSNVLTLVFFLPFSVGLIQETLGDKIPQFFFDASQRLQSARMTFRFFMKIEEYIREQREGSDFVHIPGAEFSSRRSF